MKKLLNFISNPKVKAGIILLFLLICYIFICAFSYVQAVSYDISNSVFRLHVLANSDSKEDQDLKYKVRDSLLNYMVDKLWKLNMFYKECFGCCFPMS